MAAVKSSELDVLSKRFPCSLRLDRVAGEYLLWGYYKLRFGLSKPRQAVLVSFVGLAIRSPCRPSCFLLCPLRVGT